VALKIVRTAVDEGNARPLRLWASGRKEEALELLARPAGAQHADESARVVEFALQADPTTAERIGIALAGWDDEIASYRIVKEASERLLDATSSAGANRWTPYGLALLQLTLPLLAKRPAEPVLLNYAGVALYGLGEPSLALGLFEAAGRLDPTLENLSGNIAAAKARTRTPARVILPPSVSKALKGLRDDLRRLPGRATARSTDEVRISLCMIVKDEEEMLGDCLASARDGVDEMVIVDTGSTDRTIEIAESYGAKILHFPWNGSFSDARNHGLEQATGTHVLWLDADERLEEGDALRLRELAAQPYREAHWLVETNYTGQDEVGMAATHLALRLWRNRPHYRFQGAIHEQIRVAMPTELPERFSSSKLRIRHYGYLKARIEDRDKHARNLELLLKEIERNPNDPFTHFNTGSEYVGTGNGTAARRHFERALELVRREPAWWEIGYVSLLGSRLIGVRRLTGDAEGADELATELLGHLEGFTDLVYERALLARDRGDLAAAAELFERCLAMGDAPAEFSGMAGRGTFLAMAALAQIAALQGARDEAVGWLERALSEHPGYLANGLELTELLLSAEDADPDAVLARMETIGNEQLTWWLFLGTAFYERGHAAHAELLFRRALAKGAQHPATRVGLAEALLTQHRYADVETESGDLAAGTTAFVAMQRSRVLAALLRGDEVALGDALGKLEGAASEDELAALRALHEALSGGPVELLARGTVPFLLQQLDALVRLEEFEAFERALPLLDAAIENPAVAAVVLGELYLARGFYRLAGDHALKALDSGANDARTLALLGKSAVAEGLFADALPILEACLELDPNQTAVAQLLEQIRPRVAA
jgi:glycosyltransferase involved in cell wall biosynthesis/predicted Zn-dependent protease